MMRGPDSFVYPNVRKYLESRKGPEQPKSVLNAPPVHESVTRLQKHRHSFRKLERRLLKLSGKFVLPAKIPYPSSRKL
jgi:hypothetical protein